MRALALLFVGCTLALAALPGLLQVYHAMAGSRDEPSELARLGGCGQSTLRGCQVSTRHEPGPIPADFRSPSVLYDAKQTVPRNESTLDSSETSISANSFSGMIADGSADVTASLQRALDFAAAHHLPLRICGRYKISKALRVVTKDGIRNTSSGIVGCSTDGAVLELTDRTQDGIDLSASSFGLMHWCRVENLTIRGTAQIAGSGVKLKHGNRCSINRVRFDGMYTGITLDSTALSSITTNDFINTTPAAVSPGSTAIAILGNDVNTYVIRNYADNHPRRKPSIGVSINDDVNGEYIEENSFSHFATGLMVRPGSRGKIQNIFLRQNAWDLSGDFGAHFYTPSVQSKISRIFMVNEWFAATERGPGLRFAGDGPIGNIQLDSVQIRANYSDGLQLAGNVSGGFSSVGLISTANNDALGTDKTSLGSGVNISDPRVAHVNFTGGIIGPTAEENRVQSYGLKVASGVDYLSMQGVNLEGNLMGAILFSGDTGPHCMLANNMGYVPAAKK